VTEEQINIIKGRIGEALVEALLKEADYDVCRIGSERNFQSATPDRGPAPDFVVFRPNQSGFYRLFHLEVKYRANIEFFLKEEADRGVKSVFEHHSKWPALHCVLVTDQPRRGQSCFQVANLATYQTGQVVEVKDLADWDWLDIPRDVISSYQAAVQDLFSALKYQAQLGRQLPQLRGDQLLKVGVA